MTKRLKLLCGGLVLGLMFLHVVANFYSEWLSKTRTSRRGWEAMNVSGKQVIYKVAGDGPSALLVGDEVLALKGEPAAAFPALYRDECAVVAGTSYRLSVRRDGQTQELSLQTLPHPLSDWIWDEAMLLNSLIFLVTGLTVFLLKPYDKQAWLLALMLSTFVGLFWGGDFGLSGWLLGVVIIARAVGLAFLPIFFHFFLVFPEGGPWLRRFPRLEFLLYLPFLLTILPFSGLQRIGYHLDMPGLSQRLPASRVLGLCAIVFVIAYLVGGLLALLSNYRAANVNSRRKLRVVVAGCCAGVLSLLLTAIGEFSGLPATRPQLYDWLRLPLLVTLPLIPLSFAYAIVRHQVIPVSLIIRRSVRYLLVSRGAILLDMIAVGLSVTAVLTYIFSRTRPPGIVIGLVSAAVGISAWQIASRLHDKYLAPLIDRRFFRQSYDAHQIVSELAQSLRTVKDLPQLLELVAMKIRSALQTENVTIFLRNRELGHYEVAYSCDYSEADGHAISRQRYGHLAKLTKLVEQASDNGQPVEVELEEVLSVGGGDEISALERGTLREVKAVLLTPLVSKDEMLGIISLGPRLGDLPFSREDKPKKTWRWSSSNRRGR